MEPDVFYEFHSRFSLCEGVSSIDKILSFSREQGLSYGTICDTNGFYGLINYLSSCKEHMLKPIISTRIKQDSFSTILIARSKPGFGNICKLISTMHQEDFSVREYLLENSLADVILVIDDKKFFGRENVYAEINPLNNGYGSVRLAAKEAGIPGVFVYPVYFEQQDYKVHKILRAIHLNKKLSALEPPEFAPGDSYFLNIKTLKQKYAHLSEEMHNAANLIKNCFFQFEWGSPIFPVIDNAYKTLRNLCLSNIPKRYDNPCKEVYQRLEKELDLINRKGFSSYFLIVENFVKQSNLTCGRGSAAASIVSYLLFITHVDPVKHNLYFERFLHEERSDHPDIDVDFAWDERDQIIDYIFRKYGYQRCAMVANHISFALRSSIREIGKVVGLPEEELSELKRGINFYYNRGSNDFDADISTKAYDNLKRDIIHTAKQIEGNLRHLSVHCGGVVITNEPINTYIPVEMANKGVPIVQLEKDQVEDYGLVKMDVLGNRSLAVVRDAIELIDKHTGIKINYSSMNVLNDFKTINTLSAGNTIGVFYVESPAMRQLQKKTGKGDYEHLVIHSSIIRPAANRFITEYIKRLMGKDYTPLLPEMKSILHETYGIMCYQEDITKIAVEIAGFSIKEGTELRKVIGNSKKMKRKKQLKELFYNNLKNKGIPVETVSKLWEMIESFSGYSFCKPHSASYALLSFKCCYLKVHHPAEFMGAVLKNRGGFYSPLGYISECRRLDLIICPPEINYSEALYYGRGDTIYVGFSAIKGISHACVNMLINERNNAGPFKSLMDVLGRTDVSWNDIRLLIKAGSFRNIEKFNRPQLLLIARRFFHKNTMPSSLFEIESPEFNINLKDFDLNQKVAIEIELYGFILSIHPMRYYKRFIEQNIVKINTLRNYTGRVVKIAGILITAKTVLTKHSELMQFLSFEDETGMVETSLFPRAYYKYNSDLHFQLPLLLTGKVVLEFDTIGFNILRVEKVG